MPVRPWVPPEVGIGCSFEIKVAKIKSFSCLAKSVWRESRYRIYQGEKNIDLTNKDGANMGSSRARVLCSGSSGMVGTALRAALAQSGAEVLQLVRRAPRGPGEIEWDP